VSERVFVHGAFGCSGDWAKVIRALPGGRAIDLPDCERFDDAVDAVVERAPPGAELVGYSMGGRVALAAALRRPEHFSALALVSATAGLEHDDERARRLDVDDARARALARDPARFLTEFWSLPLFRTLDDHPSRASRLRERIERVSRDPDRAARTFRALSVARQPNHWPRLGSLNVPTLFIAGALDEKYARLARRMHERTPGSRLAIVDGAGHSLPLEAPRALAAALRELAAPVEEAA
jgi:2-succinyl-6-hydroxy-2,4-cyclohexadiene-1-carboxylate synthase